jgi:SPP1 family predicted phage head-tail adaptor
MIERYFSPGITIERYTEGTDELGNPTKSWVHHLDTVGLIDAQTGNEQLAANAPTVSATHILFCPVIDITEKDRVKYRGKTYNVKFVDDPMNYGRHLEVLLEVQ